MKTVLIPIFDGAVGRNILRTGILSTLKNAGVRVIILPPRGKIDYYRSEFDDGQQIIVEASPIWRHSRWEFILAGLFLQSIPTNFMKIRQADWYWNQKKYIHYIGASLLRSMGRFRWWQKVLRSLESWQPIPGYLKKIFEKWQPDLVFLPTMIPRDEVALAKLAKRNGKISVGMVKSWDNLTSKAFLRVFPDWIVAHSEITKRDAADLYGYPEDRIFVSGIPQFDRYADSDFIEPRNAFFKKIGADPAKQLILYAPAGDWMNPHDKEVVEMLLSWIERGELPNAQVLLRLHPGYESQTEELRGRANLIVERPGKHLTGNLKEFEFEEDDMRHLASSLFYSALSINTASTMTVEAAAFDRPVILVGFDGRKQFDYWHSVVRYYDREHYRQIMKSGGAWLVKSPIELLDAVKTYLRNPALHREGRKQIVREQCIQIDGKAGERIGDFLLEKLNSSHAESVQK